MENYRHSVRNTIRNNRLVNKVACNIMRLNNRNCMNRRLSFLRNTLANARKGGFCMNDVNEAGIECNVVCNTYPRAFFRPL